MNTDYNDALSRARQGKPLEEIFPELAEDKVRATLKKIICRAINDDLGLPYDERDYISRKVLPYVEMLEQIKDQQGTEQNTEDRYMEGYQKGYADAERTYNNGVAFHIDNPNIQRLDPNVVIETTTDGTHE